MDLFKKKVFSKPNSDSIVKEQSTYVFFRNFLEELECKFTANSIVDVYSIYFFVYHFLLLGGGDMGVTMGDVLSFFTGAESIPPLGFGDATLSFNDVNPYPTASTCALCLTLPTMYHNDYPKFKEKFLFGIVIVVHGW